MRILAQVIACAEQQRTSSGGNPTAPTSSMWKSSFPKGQDPREKDKK